MLFNSIQFIFGFLPVTLLGFYILYRLSLHPWMLYWLIAASAFFYAWWNPPYLALLATSIFANYFLGIAMGRSKELGKDRSTWILLVGGIVLNLFVIGYFKYSNFFISNVNHIFDSDYHFRTIILPLGISFFTFQQIAYLVDTYQGKAQHRHIRDYCLFVVFFPQLIAGPIVHYREIIPQFSNFLNLEEKQLAENISVGITFFALGLFKKVIIADTLLHFSNPAFNLADQGDRLEMLSAWYGALAYTSQLYFDFSGYSDMAIGLAWLFGIRLPINFDSPYKSKSIREFWRRWHITLSNFLRDYLYIPLGGNRAGNTRRDANLMTTMLLGGLWHGAGWNFIVWGGLHGAYLVVNGRYHAFARKTGFDQKWHSFVVTGLGAGLTFLAVTVGWIFFRSSTLSSALSYIRSALGGSGVSIDSLVQTELAPVRNFLYGLGIVTASSPIKLWTVAIATAIILIPLFCTFYGPNTYQIVMGQGGQSEAKTTSLAHEEAQSRSPATLASASTEKRNHRSWLGLLAGLLIFVCAKHLLSSPESEFIYFNF